jgi:hypothetical protein
VEGRNSLVEGGVPVAPSNAGRIVFYFLLNLSLFFVGVVPYDRDETVQLDEWHESTSVSKRRHSRLPVG